MNKRWLTFLLSLAIVVFADRSRAQETRRSDEVRLVSVGHITRINLQKKSFELASEPADASGGGEAGPQGSGTQNDAGRAGGWHGGVSIGIGGGRRGGVDSSRRGEPANQPMPPWPGDEPPDQTVRTTVKTTGETLYKDGDQPSAFGSLRVGDAVEVTGVLRGRDIEAKEIVRRGKQ